MGVHKEPNFKIYWEIPKPDKDGLQHTISKYMLLNRYENLRRYLHIAPPESNMEPQEPLNNEDKHY